MPRSLFRIALWVVRHDGNGLLAPVPSLEALWLNLATWPGLVGVLALTLAGALLLVVLNIARFGSNADDVPVVIRPPLSAFARYFIVFFALAPLIVGSILGAAQRLDHVVGGAGVALLMMGLLIVLIAGEIIYLRRQRILRLVWAGLIAAPAVAIVGVSLLLPWTIAASVKTSQPAAALGRFFGDSFERRTGQRLPAVAGDPDLALLIALTAPGRPASSPRRDAASHAVAIAGAFLGDRRHRSVAGAGYGGCAACGDQASFPQSRAGSAARLRAVQSGARAAPRVGWAIVRPRGG